MDTSSRAPFIDSSKTVITPLPPGRPGYPSPMNNRPMLKNRRLGLEVAGAVALLLIAGVAFARRLREIARAEEQKRRAELERLARLEKMRAEKLTKDAADWELANRIRGYVQELEKRSDTVEGLAEWVEWAKGYADKIDPLSRQDELGFNPRSPYY